MEKNSMLNVNITAPLFPLAAMNNKFGVSFCIPTYNRIATLAEAVASILALKGLDDTNYEILISDDSDNDLTKEYVLNLALSNEKIKYLKNFPKGQFNNLNNLITQARSPWIVFLHDDDKLHSDYLMDVFHGGIQKDETVEVIWTGRRNVDDKGKGIKICCASNNRTSLVVLNGKIFFEQMLSINNYTYFGKLVSPMVTGLALKRDLILKSGLFDNRFKVNGDALFLWKILYFSNKAAYVNKPLVDYRVTDDTERAKPSEKGIIFCEMKNLVIALLEFLKTILDANDYAEKKKQYMGNFYMNAMNINGPVLWTALRYKNGYLCRLRIQLGIFFESASAAPLLFFKPTTLFVLLISFLPQCVLKFLYKIYSMDFLVNSKN